MCTDIIVSILSNENQFENIAAYKDQVIATGLPASPGAAVGQIVFTAEDAEAWHAQGKPCILVNTIYHHFLIKKSSAVFVSFLVWTFTSMKRSLIEENLSIYWTC